jgi:hypothetical protein
MCHTLVRYKLPALAVGALVWLYAGFALAGAYVDSLWADTSPELIGAGLTWLVVGAVAVVALHVYLLLRVWRIT